MRGAQALLAGLSVAVGTTCFSRAFSAKQRAVDRALLQAHKADEEASYLAFQLSKLRQIHSAGTAAMRSLERRLAAAEANALERSAQADAALSQLAAMKRLVEEEHHKAAAMKAQHAAEVRALTAEVATATGQVETAQNGLRTAIQRHELELDGLTTKLQAAATNNTQLQRCLVETQAEASQLGDTAKAAEQQVTALRVAHGEEVRALMAKVSTAFSQVETANKDLRAAIQRHELEKDGLCTKLQAANAHNSQLQRCLVETQAQASRLGDMAKVAEQQVAALQVAHGEVTQRLVEEEARKSCLVKTVINQDRQLKEQVQLMRIMRAKIMELEQKAVAGNKAAEAERKAPSADADAALHTPSRQGSTCKRAEPEGAPQDAPEPDSARVLQAARSFKLRADAPAFAPAPPAIPAPVVAPAPAVAPVAPAKEVSMLNPRAAPFVPSAAKASVPREARVQQAVQAPAPKAHKLTPAPKAATAPKDVSQAKEVQLAPAVEGPAPAPEPLAPAPAKLSRSAMLLAGEALSSPANPTQPPAVPASVAASPPATAVLSDSAAPAAKPGGFFALRPVAPPRPHCMWIYERRLNDPTDR